MTGMFQSSRIASGRPRLQASSAFSPSSASMIWKSSPSRMRRATLRMTLESSTTRHVLILAPQQQFPFREILVSTLLDAAARLRRLQLGHDFKHAIDVEHDHELTVEAMDTTGELGHTRVEIDRIFLTAVFRQPQHLADLVDQQAIGLAAQVDADRHRRLAVLFLRQAETRARVDPG